MTLVHQFKRITLGLSFLAVVGLSSARGQQTTMPPGFDPYSAPFRAFAFPGAGTDPSLPNLQRYGNGVPGSGIYDTPGNPTDFTGDRSPSVSRSRRYDSAYRRYDEIMGRDYNPNAKIDADYYADRQKIEERQLEAMRETNPAKRRELLRQIDRDSREKAADPSLSLRRRSPINDRASANLTAARGSIATNSPTTIQNSRYRASFLVPGDILERSRRLDLLRSGN